MSKGGKMNKELNKKKESDFELDTVENISRLLPKVHRKVSLDENRLDASNSGKPNSKKAFSLMMISICVAVLLVAVVGFVCVHNQKISLSFFSGGSGNSSKNILRVGPISTTLANNDVIRFSMDIGLESESAEKNLAEKTAIIKNQIISTIMAPETAELIETHQYDLVKAKIHEALERTTGESVTGVYFSDLRFF